MLALCAEAERVEKISAANQSVIQHAWLLIVSRLQSETACVSYLSKSSCFQLFQTIRLPDPIPLLWRHYRALNAHMDRSAPVSGIGILALRFSPLGLLASPACVDGVRAAPVGYDLREHLYVPFGERQKI